MNDTKLAQEIHEAEVKAIKALAGYKFSMFGYWAGIWVHLNRIEGKKRPSPFKFLVHAARELPVSQGGRTEVSSSWRDCTIQELADAWGVSVEQVKVDIIEGRALPDDFRGSCDHDVITFQRRTQESQEDVERHGTGMREKLQQLGVQIPYEPDPGTRTEFEDPDEPVMVDAEIDGGEIRYSLSAETITRILDQAFAQVRQSGRATIELYEVNQPNDYAVCWCLLIDSGVIKIRTAETGDLVTRERVEELMAIDINLDTHTYRVGTGL